MIFSFPEAHTSCPAPNDVHIQAII